MRGEFIQKSIMDMLEKDCLYGIDLDYTFKGQPQILSERMNDDIPWIPIEILLQFDSYSKQHRQFLATYEKIISNQEFRNLFNVHGISLWNELESTFKKMVYAPHLPFYLNLLDSLYLYFSKNKPKAIFLPYETGPFALAFISIFKKLGIKTIGVQHGYIYPNSPMYSQTHFSNDNSPYGFPLPDITLVFGNYVKDLLVKNGYPSEKLVVFGNPSLFNLEKIKSEFDKEKLLKQFHILPNQKVIIFTTGKLQREYSEAGKYDYDEKIWELLLKNFSGKNNLFIILKPHPSEKNISIYEKISKNYHSNNIKILRHDIFELIQLSSVVVSVFSSTMFDSLCFNKPVIRIKFQNEEPHVLDESNAIITSDLNNMYQNILKILNNPELKSSLEKNISEFVKEHYGIPENHPELILKKILEN